MNIVEAFANWLGTESVATLGQDLFISRSPKQPNSLYWLIAAGGASGNRNVNEGVLQTHNISVYFRDNDGQVVYDNLHDLEEMVLTTGCLTLEGYEVISISTDGPFTDNDLDNESRTVGLLQITIETYRS